MLRSWLGQAGLQELVEQQPVTWNDEWMVWDIWPHSHPSLRLSGICTALFGSREILNLIRERFTSEARGRDRRHQPTWDRWKCPDKLGLGSGLCCPLFPIIIFFSFIYLFEPLVIKRKKEDSCYHLPLFPQSKAWLQHAPTIPLQPQRQCWQQSPAREPLLPKLLTAFTASKSKAGPASLPSAFPQPPAQTTTSALGKEKEIRNYGQN